MHVRRILGHRNIQNTVWYAENAQFESEEFHSAVAKTIDEATKLIDAGFEFVCVTLTVKSCFEKENSQNMLNA
jgi:hypothetical protein